MDVSGENQIDVDHNLFKQRLTLSGELVEDEPEKHEGNGCKQSGRYETKVKLTFTYITYRKNNENGKVKVIYSKCLC